MRTNRKAKYIVIFIANMIFFIYYSQFFVPAAIPKRRRHFGRAVSVTAAARRFKNGSNGRRAAHAGPAI